jgi:hypothetical protein
MMDIIGALKRTVPSQQNGISNMLMMQLVEIILVPFLHYPFIPTCFAVRIMTSSMLCVRINYAITSGLF